MTWLRLHIRVLIIAAGVGGLSGLSLLRQYASANVELDSVVLAGLVGTFFGLVVGLGVQLVRGPAPDKPKPESPWVSVGLMVAMGLAFAAEHTIDAVGPDYVAKQLGLLSAGALVPDLVREGELWRLFTAPWIFEGTEHLLLSLLGVGLIVPRLLRRRGPAAVVTCALVPPVLASAIVASLVPHGIFTLGSASLFSLVGAAIVSEIVAYRREQGPHPHWLWWTSVAGAAAATGLVPLNHGGVCVLAMLAGAGLMRLALLRGAEARGSWGLWSASGLTALGLVWAVNAALTIGLADGRDDMQDLLRLIPNLTDATRLNNAAWTIAEDPMAGMPKLEVAHELSRRSLELSPDEDSFQDTMATLEHRRGHHDVAARMEFEVAFRNDNALFWSQFSRFARRAPNPEGASMRPDGSLDRSSRIEVRDHWLVAWWRQGEAPTLVWELMKDDGAAVGTLVVVNTSTRTGSRAFAMPEAMLEAVEAGATLHPLWVQAHAEPRWDGWLYYPHSPDVDHLP